MSAMNLTERDTLLSALLMLSASGALHFEKTSNPAYVAALCDLLQLLHLVRPISGGVMLDGETERMFVRSIAAHLADNVPMALDWHARLDQAVAAHGTQLLADVELVRKGSVTHPTPIREIVAVNAIFKAPFGGEDCLLMQYDDRARQFQLIGGKREPEDIDAAATLLREIREELEMPDLRTPADLTLVPIGERFEQITLSPSYGVVTSYHISFFHVTDMHFRPHTDALTRWIGIEHIRHGVLPDGRKVSDLAIQSLDACLGDLAYSLTYNLDQAAPVSEL